MRTYKSEVIIIKRFNVGEADRILTVFSRHDGKFSVRAKGIRRVPSRRSAHVELLNHVMLTLYEGRSLPTLTEAQSIENYQDIKDDFSKIGLAYHLCELINGLCPDGQEHRDIFELIRKTLRKLSACQSQSQIADPQRESFAYHPQKEVSVPQTLFEIVHDFEIELLTMLGYWKADEKAAQKLNTTAFIEDILERRLKSRRIFNKIS